MMRKIVNYILHIIEIAVVMWKYDGAYIVITKDRNTGMFKVVERGTVLELNRDLRKKPQQEQQGDD